SYEDEGKLQALNENEVKIISNLAKYEAVASGVLSDVNIGGDSLAKEVTGVDHGLEMDEKGKLTRERKSAISGRVKFLVDTTVGYKEVIWPEAQKRLIEGGLELESATTPALKEQPRLEGHPQAVSKEQRRVETTADTWQGTDPQIWANDGSHRRGRS